MHDQAANRRAKQRPDQCRDDHEIHCFQQLCLWKGANDGQSTDRHHHCSTHSLQNAGGNKHGYIQGQAAEQGGKGEYHHCSTEHASRAETVSHPAADGNAHGQAQYVTGDNGFQAQRCHMEARRHGWHSRVDDGRVKLLHE